MFRFSSHSWHAILLFVLLLPTTLSASQQISDKVSVDGVVRSRVEIDGRDFDQDTGMYSYGLLRTMLGVRVTPNDKLTIRIKVKDSRVLGTTGSNSISSNFLDLQEGYLVSHNFLNLPVDLQIGRYEMMYGRRRILGNGGWNNYGPRTYDGFRVIYDKDDSFTHFFYATIVERSYASVPPYTGDAFDKQDRHLFGITGSYMQGFLQPILMIDYDPRTAPSPSQNDALYMITAANYLKYRSGNISADFDLGYQYGQRWDHAYYAGTSTFDLTAWLAALDIAYTFDHSTKPSLGVGFDATSGTSFEDEANHEDHVFYIPFMSRHAYRGYMDYFKDVRYGLLDMMVKAGVKPWEGTQIDLTFHNFSYLESSQTSVVDDGEKALGQEFDLRIRKSLSPGFNMDMILCRFHPGDAMSQSGDPSHFAALTLSATF